MTESVASRAGRRFLGDDKKTKLVQLRYSDKEFESLERCTELVGVRDVTAMVRKATHDYTTRIIEVKVKGKPVLLQLGEARELLKDLAAKVY